MLCRASGVLCVRFPSLYALNALRVAFSKEVTVMFPDRDISGFGWLGLPMWLMRKRFLARAFAFLTV